MSNELFANYPGDNTIYAHCVKQSDGTFWNGSAFEAYNGANIGNYDIPLSLIAGTLYGEDVPSGIVSGTVLIVTIYEQQGGSPATDDLNYPLKSYLLQVGSVTVVPSGGSYTVGNAPWFSSTEFTQRVRITVGDGNEISTLLFNACSDAAHAKVQSFLPDGARIYRIMLDHVPGERVPQNGIILEDGSHAHTLLFPTCVTGDTTKTPRVWRNLDGPWENRWDNRSSHLLTVTEDYTITGTTLTILDASEGDVYHVDYWHSLDTKPEVLKDLAIMVCAEMVLAAQFGTDSARYEDWSKQYRELYDTRLQMLRAEQLGVPEFDIPVLYNDWSDADSEIGEFFYLRG